MLVVHLVLQCYWEAIIRNDTACYMLNNVRKLASDLWRQNQRYGVNVLQVDLDVSLFNGEFR